MRRSRPSASRRRSTGRVKLTVIVVLPATVALVVLAGPLTVTIFHYGKFNAHDVRMSSLALMAYASGLLAFSMVKVLAPGLLRAAGHAHAGAHRHPGARR